MRDNGVVLLSRKRGGETKRLRSRTGWEFTWEDDDDLVAYPDASVLLARVSEALLRHHVDVIRAGKDPATGQALPPLDPDGTSGVEARLGKRPNIRGVARRDGRDLASLLTRSKISASNNVKVGRGRVGGSARCIIGGGSGGHATYLQKASADHGVDHLAVEGDAEKVIDEAVSAWLDEMLQGEPEQPPFFGPLQGRDL